MNYKTESKLLKEIVREFGVPASLLREAVISFVTPGISNSAHRARMFQGICAGVRCSEASGAVLTVWSELGECEVRPSEVKEIVICLSKA